MSIFRKSPPPLPPSRGRLEEKLESIRPGAGEVAQTFEPEEVTGLIDLTLERVQVAQTEASNVLGAAVNRLADETRRTKELARQLTVPPKP